MEFRLIIFILAIVTVLTGCNNNGKEESKVSTLTLDNVTQAMKKQGLKLQGIHPKGGTSLFEKIYGVTAATYSITNDGSNVSAVNVYVYVFDSIEARFTGRTEIDDIFARANFAAIPSVFEKYNVLVIHFKSPNENEEYDVMIESAVKKLN
jgi:hypothetical protein